MDTLVVALILGIFGAVLGSFAGAQVWRLRARQLEYDKQAKEPYDKAEYKRLKKLLGKKVVNDRSCCLECGYKLKWYDLLPIVSWLSLRGKCRACRRPIGVFELLIELGLAAYFVLSFLFWPTQLATGLEIIHLALWLIAGVIMAVLLAYDAKWYLLPDRYSLALAVVGVAIVAVVALQADNVAATLFSALGAVALMAGLYGVLYAFSRGRWVGFGDVKLGVGLGLILVDWQLALVALFLANLLGCLVVIPLLARRTLQRTSHVPFGPFLIAGTILAWFTGAAILGWYLGIAGF